ncbi:class I ribonucleotide reductase maintenance protein YfaE [Aliidiomarina haloalkalitolerans]|uniref:(Fe-S)-binding protein n=1 Tax=Aliidiomarina haloalkalitolerans TaxID=859059 RepID=A0A432VYJ7_9GAMM|nr:class I ribonucleotide reductase maintenance protein YfaE [Aliidiomarina haloalkalitolerans]MCL4409614.1 class I ribonucleotide reductase maintenance protein YfaE [Gammaproteobacteria bacterium]RUO21734.1 (Fe-S)-binding protein [Aliidiomarina haloalkalitolerans]
MTSFRVTINQTIVTEVAADAPTSLLETIEAAGIEARFHCRNGFCGACRTRLISGNVHYTTEPLAYVRTGDILPCVCRPSTNIEIEHE